MMFCDSSTESAGRAHVRVIDACAVEWRQVNGVVVEIIYAFSLYEVMNHVEVHTHISCDEDDDGL